MTLKKRSTDGMRMKQNGAIGSGDKPMLNVWLTGSALQHLGAVLEIRQLIWLRWKVLQIWKQQ